MRKFRFSMSTTHYILLSFFVVILLGSALLALPISSASGEAIPFVDALFTATTATCVTGLVVVPTVTTWSLFGQIVILILIQIGGLGIITIMAGITVTLHRRMKLSDRLVLQDSFNLNTLSGLEVFVKKVIKGTLVVEAIGACCYMTVFVPQFGLRGIWISVFTSVSAFCNAGIDILAENSLCNYVVNPVVNITTCALIIFGGLGYIVWWDLLRVCRGRREKKVSFWKALTLHSKLVLCTTISLIVIGGALIFLFEYNNSNTIQNYSFLEKIEISLFQSITTRTAGFATIPQENLSNSSAILCLLLMFIGGSPVGTAGGIKTVTFAVIVFSAIATIKNQKEASVFGRSISREMVGKATAVTGMSFVILFLSTISLSAVVNTNALDVIYETVSATATVGLTRNLTPFLNLYGKLIIIATMYLGRVGPISLAIAFSFKREKKNIIKNPVEDIRVG